MKTPTAKTVAILGTRYGNLAIEQQMLGPLGVQLVESPGQSEVEIVRAAAGAHVIVCGGAPKITAAVIRQQWHRKQRCLLLKDTSLPP